MKRKSFHGVRTVVRFNWHLHAIALATCLVLAAAGCYLTGIASALAWLAAAAAFVQIVVSLAATWIAYDASGLYRLEWLAPLLEGAECGGNFHAGFDETSPLLWDRFPGIHWRVFDFYDPEKHTEISIRRARKVQPPSPQTVAIRTGHIPLADGSLDCALLILAAHEIRDPEERAGFFTELLRSLAPGGRVIVTEHLRDPANIAAYSMGAWHFHTRAAWLATFHAAGFHVAREFRNNAFITTFVLEPNENPD